MNCFTKYTLSALFTLGIASGVGAQTVNFDDLASPAVGVGAAKTAYTQNGFSILRIPDPLDPASFGNHFHTVAGSATPGFPNATAAEFFSDDGAPIRYYFGNVVGTGASNYAVGTQSPFNLVSLNVLEIEGEFTLTASNGQVFVLDHAGIYNFGAAFAGISEFRHDYTADTEGGMILDDIMFRPTTFRVISGRVTIDGTNAAPSVVNVELRIPGTTTVLRTFTFTPESDGAYTLSGVPDSVYDLAFKGNNTLRLVAPNVATTSGNISNMDIALSSGDANGDNSVDIGDFGLLVNAYNGSANIPNSGYDIRADFNSDGMVDIADFGLLVNSYNLVGAN